MSGAIIHFRKVKTARTAKYALTIRDKVNSNTFSTEASGDEFVRHVQDLKSKADLRAVVLTGGAQMPHRHLSDIRSRSRIQCRRRP